jgi:hypothetical protein
MSTIIEATQIIERAQSIENGSGTALWKSKAIAEYQKVIAALLSLSSATIGLPVFLMRDFLAIDKNVPLKQVLTLPIYASWAFLAAAIFACIIYYHFCAKWLKEAYGGPVFLSAAQINCILDLAFWTAAMGYVLGFACLMYFLVTAQPVNPAAIYQ